MNENIDLTKILKDCPKGTKLYSPIFGEVSLITSNDISQRYPIAVRLNDKTEETFTSEGKLLNNFDGECSLFPSKDHRDWSKFTAPWYKKEKFDPKTLQPFDKVMIRDNNYQAWVCTIFSHHQDEDCESIYYTASGAYFCCIPYNDDTKHLVGTTDEAPEFYRHWDD